MREKIRGISPDFSDWKFLGADIEAALVKSHGPCLHSDHVCAAMTVAIEPKTLEIALNDSKARPLADAFTTGMITNPESMIKVFQVVRGKWHNANPSARATVQKFIATNPVVQLANGKQVILSSKTTDDEIAQGIQSAGGPIVTTNTVKSARRGLRLPKTEILLISHNLKKAILHFRELGFGQFW